MLLAHTVPQFSRCNQDSLNRLVAGAGFVMFLASLGASA
jgi:hypothetical protein